MANMRDGIPSRRDFHLRDLGQHAVHIAVLEIKNEPTDFIYRLIGSNVVENLAANYTGKLLSDLPGKGPESQIWQTLQDVRTQKAPLFREIPYIGPNEKYKSSKTLYLPLANDHITPDKIMIVPDFPAKKNVGLFSPKPYHGENNAPL